MVFSLILLSCSKILIQNNRQGMIDFNLDYLSKQLVYNQRIKELKGFNSANVENMVNLMSFIYRKNKQNCLGISFIRLSVARRVKVEKLLQIQKTIMRCYEDCFLKIKRYSVLADKSNQIKADNKLNYPVSILNRVLSINQVHKLQTGWEKIVKYQKYKDLLEMRLWQVEQLCERYQKRMHMRELYSIFRKVLDKKNQAYNHMLSFQKQFEILRVKNLFIAFSQIIIKTDSKVISDLERQKAGKRDESVKANSKRNEQINELKRKTNNMKGQVNEESMRNAKKRTDGSRQNGSKLMKKNEQLRGIEMAMTQTVNDIQRMEKEIMRKENFISNRPKVATPFQFLRGTYNEFIESESNQIGKAQVQSKIGKGQLAGFRDALNCITADNIKLKYIISLYEQLQNSKKSDSYLNLDNENSSLKGLIGSIIRMQYFQPRREKIMKNIDEINSNFVDLRLQLSQIRAEKLDYKRK